MKGTRLWVFTGNSRDTLELCTQTQIPIECNEGNLADSLRLAAKDLNSFNGRLVIVRPHDNKCLIFNIMKAQDHDVVWCTIDLGIESIGNSVKMGFEDALRYAVECFMMQEDW